MYWEYMGLKLVQIERFYLRCPLLCHSSKLKPAVGIGHWGSASLPADNVLEADAFHCRWCQDPLVDSCPRCICWGRQNGPRLHSRDYGLHFIVSFNLFYGYTELLGNWIVGVSFWCPITRRVVGCSVSLRQRYVFPKLSD